MNPALVLASLRTGPKAHAQIAADFIAAKPGLELDRAMIWFYRTVYKLREKGKVRREVGKWGLVR